MLLPANFSQTIADTFYDKTVSLLSKTKTTSDGWVTETGTASSTFKANVQFDKLAEVQSQLGLTEQIDVSITCATSVGISIDDLFSYNSQTYKATAVVPHDSHLMVVGRKWG